MRHLKGSSIPRSISRFPSSAFRNVVMEPNSGALEILQRFARKIDERDGKNMQRICHAGPEVSQWCGRNITCFCEN